MMIAKDSHERKITEWPHLSILDLIHELSHLILQMLEENLECQGMRTQNILPGNVCRDINGGNWDMDSDRDETIYTKFITGSQETIGGLVRGRNIELEMTWSCWEDYTNFKIKARGTKHYHYFITYITITKIQKYFHVALNICLLNYSCSLFNVFISLQQYPSKSFNDLWYLIK